MGLPHGGVPQIVSPLTPYPSNLMGGRKTSNNWGQININNVALTPIISAEQFV